MFAAGSVLVSIVFVGVLLQVWREHVLQQYVGGSSVSSGVVDTSTVAAVKVARIRQKLLPRPHPIPQQTRVFGVKRREEVSLLNFAGSHHLPEARDRDDLDVRRAAIRYERNVGNDCAQMYSVCTLSFALTLAASTADQIG